MNIVNEIGMPAMMGQLAEECAELAKAALKYQRILMGKNPTPVPVDEALANLQEESQDVKDCIKLIEKAGIPMTNIYQTEEKMERWENRIKEAGNEKS